jgi:hypothetical protein
MHCIIQIKLIADDVYKRIIDCTTHVERPSLNRHGTALFRHSFALLLEPPIIRKKPIDDRQETNAVAFAKV